MGKIGLPGILRGNNVPLLQEAIGILDRKGFTYRLEYNPDVDYSVKFFPSGTSTFYSGIREIRAVFGEQKKGVERKVV